MYVADSANVYGGGAAGIGAAYLPFVVGADPNHPQFKVNNLSLTADLRDRLDDRVSLLKAIDQVKHGVDTTPDLADLDHFNTKAIDLLTSERAVNAFDISQEDEATRERYGRHKWGQRALLARRLVEAGVSFVTMQMQNPSIAGGIGNWDIHAVNGHLFKIIMPAYPFLTLQLLP